MSLHSCNELCDLDVRFHVIQKYQGPSEIWSTDRSGMKEFILEKIEEYYELLKLLK